MRNKYVSKGTFSHPHVPMPRGFPGAQARSYHSKFGAVRTENGAKLKQRKAVNHKVMVT